MSNPAVTIASVPYRTSYGLELDNNVSGITNAYASVHVNAAHLSGYNALAFYLGFADYLDTYNSPSQGDPAAKATFEITRDGQVYRNITVAAGQAAQYVTVPFQGHTVLEFSASRTDGDSGDACLLMADPTAIVIGPGRPCLPFVAPSVAPGGRQTVTLRTAPGAFVSFIVTYPQGRPLVVGPFRASPAGKFSYSFSVPGNVHGTARIVAVAAGQIIQGKFTIR